MKTLRKLLCVVLCVSMLIAPMTVMTGGYDYTTQNGAFIFDSEDKISYMSGINSLDLSYNSKENAMQMKVTKDQGDPYALLDLSKYSFTASSYGYLVVTYKVDANASGYASMSEIFISAGIVTGPTGGKSVRYNVQKGGYKSQIINLSALSWWKGDIYSFRLDCFASARAGDILYVDSIILCSDEKEANTVAFDRAGRGITERNPYYGTDLECVEYDSTKYTSPFWKGNIIYSEAVSPIQNKDGSYTFNLMYEPDKIISVYSGDYSAYFEEGVDYTVSGNQITLISGGNIPSWEYSFINHRNQNDTSAGPLYAQLAGGYGLWGRDDIFMRGYLNVTYTHNDAWEHYVPTSKADKLPNTAKAIKNNESYNIVLFGDSIAGGAVSSKYRDIFPYADYWYEQIETTLREDFGHTNLKMSNVSEGGSSASGMVDYFENNILPKNPDLLILEFGVNDAQNESVSSNYSASRLKSNFKSALRDMIELARDNNSECEILIVSPFYSNITFFREEMFEACRDACLELENEYSGVAVANVTDMQGSLLEEKSIHCFLGDNLCHPNDYMARIYAQTCLATILPEELGYDAYVPEGTEVTLNGISVTKLPNKTSYVAGQNISFDGLEITAKYSDGTTKVVTPDSIAYDKTKTGTVTVVVSYQGKTATFSITVAAKVVKSISVTAPAVTTFHAGNQLDLTGGKVKVVYESTDGYSETFALDSSMISGYNSNTVGKQTITVTYGGKTATFEVETYINYTMVVYPAPGGGSVYQGSELNYKEYMVNLICEDYPQFNRSFFLDESMVSGEIDTETPGSHYVEVTYGDLTAEIFYVVIVKGDVDGDGKLTMMDVFRMKLFVKQMIDPDPSNRNDYEADVNDDGLINMVDSFELKYRVKMGEWRN